MDIMLSRIIELLGEKRGNRNELAKHLGVSPNLITNWKSGVNGSYPKYARQIAEYFDVSVDYLCGNTDEKGIKKEPTSNRSELISSIINLFNQLQPDEAAKVLAYTQGLIDNRVD